MPFWQPRSAGSALRMSVMRSFLIVAEPPPSIRMPVRRSVEQNRASGSGPATVTSARVTSRAPLIRTMSPGSAIVAGAWMVTAAFACARTVRPFFVDGIVICSTYVPAQTRDFVVGRRGVDRRLDRGVGRVRAAAGAVVHRERGGPRRSRAENRQGTGDDPRGAYSIRSSRHVTPPSFTSLASCHRPGGRAPSDSP